jgi:hypothetical protein
MNCTHVGAQISQKMKEQGLGMVADPCNPTYAGGRGGGNHSSKPVPDQNVRP